MDTDNIDNLFFEPVDSDVGAFTETEEPTSKGPSSDTTNTTFDGEQDQQTENDPFSVDEADSYDVAFNKTEAKVDSLFEQYGPMAAALIPHLNSPSPEIPLASRPFPHTLKKVAGAGDSALRICNDGPLRYLIIGELASHEKWNINKVGPYLDMLYQQNGQETLTLDSLKRGKAKLVLRSLSIPDDATEDGRNLMQQANERFNRLAAFLSVVQANYQESQSERDALLYPNGVSGSSWLYQGSNFYGMTVSTLPIFANVPAGTRRLNVAPVVRLQGNYLAPVDRIQDENKQRNRGALEVTPDNAHDLSLLANWPDPDGHIRNLADNVFLGAVRVKEPDVFDSLGVRIHPSLYSDYFVPGTRVAVQAVHKLWDITSQRNGNPVANPSRHCVTIAEEIYIIPDDDEDIRDSIHRFEARTRAETTQVKERERIAEEQRQTSKAQEAARVIAAAAHEEYAAAKRRDREERLKSMWQVMSSSPSSSPQASTSSGYLLSSPVSLATASSSSTPSTPSPSKRKASENPPDTPSPSKRPTARMSTGGKPPKLIAKADQTTESGRSTRSKGKGKGKVDDDMQIDS